MSEEKTTEQPKETSEEAAFRECQNEWLQLCAAAGEKQHLITNLRKDLLKINIRMRKLNKKAGPLGASLRAKQEAKAKLTVVPQPEAETA